MGQITAEGGLGGHPHMMLPRDCASHKKSNCLGSSLRENNYLRDWWEKRLPGRDWEGRRNTSILHLPHCTDAPPLPPGVLQPTHLTCFPDL